MGLINRIFGAKPTAKQALVGETVEERVIVQAVKKTHYHEIVNGVVRIYHREKGIVEEAEGGSDPYAVALSLLRKHNGGAS